MAELSCGGSCMKYILFLFNIIFFLCGGAILGVGIWALVDDSFGEYIEIVNFDDSNPYFDYAVYTLIAVGGLIFLVGFLGCCGACTESPTLLLFFALLLGLVVILQVTAGVMAVVFREDLGGDLEAAMVKQVYNDVTIDENDPITAAWNSVQTEFNCCGANSYKNYYNSTFDRAAGADIWVPSSCCTPTSSEDDCQREAGPTGFPPFLHLYSTGCYTEIKVWLEDNAIIVIGAAFGIAVVEAIGIIFACCVRSQLNK